MKEILAKSQVLANTGEFDKALHLLESTLPTVSTPEDRINVNNSKALVYYKKGETEKAENLFEENLREAINIAHETGEEVALYHLARSYTSKGDLELGNQLVRRLIDRFQSKRGDVTEFKGRITLLEVLIDLLEGRYDEAISKGKESLTLFSGLKDQEEMEESLNLIAGAYKGKGDFDKALLTYLELLAEAKKADSVNLGTLGKCYNNIAVIYRTVGSYREAMEYFKKHLELVETIGDRHSMAFTYANLGRTSIDKGDPVKALQYLKRAEDIFMEDKDFRGLALTLGEIAETCYYLNNHEKAREYFEKTIDYYQKTGLVELYSERLASYIDLLIDSHELDSAEIVLGKLQELTARKDSRLDSIYCRYQEANLDFYRGNMGSSKEKFLAALAETEAIGLFTISITINLNLARIFFESYAINGEKSDLEAARIHVNAALMKSIRENLHPSAVNALMVQAMFYVNDDARLQDALHALESARAISEERGLEEHKQRIEQLTEQILHRSTIINGAAGKLDRNGYNELARAETSLVLKTALGIKERLNGKKEIWLTRSYIAVFLITPAGPNVHYADLLPLKGEQGESQDTIHGQLSLFITLAIQQGREENVPEGIFGPLPVADMKNHFAYVYSSAKMAIGPVMVCFIIPRESIALFLNRITVLETFRKFLMDLSFKEINEESMNALKKELFRVKNPPTA